MTDNSLHSDVDNFVHLACPLSEQPIPLDLALFGQQIGKPSRLRVILIGPAADVDQGILNLYHLWLSGRCLESAVASSWRHRGDHRLHQTEFPCHRLARLERSLTRASATLSTREFMS